MYDEVFAMILDGIQIFLTITVSGITLFKTVAQPLKKNMVHQLDLTREVQATNKNLCKLIEENRTEHEAFRAMLSDHEKRIYKMED